MNIVIITPVRLLADCLEAGLNGREGIQAIAIVDNLSTLRETLALAQFDLVLIDVTQGVDWDQLEELAADFPQVALWSLGTEQQLHDLKLQGLSSISGYISRSISVEALYQAITDPTEEHPANSTDTVAKSSGFSFAKLFHLKTAGDKK